MVGAIVAIASLILTSVSGSTSQLTTTQLTTTRTGLCALDLWAIEHKYIKLIEVAYEMKLLGLPELMQLVGLPQPNNPLQVQALNGEAEQVRLGLTQILDLWSVDLPPDRWKNELLDLISRLERAAGQREDGRQHTQNLLRLHKIAQYDHKVSHFFFVIDPAGHPHLFLPTLLDINGFDKLPNQGGMNAYLYYAMGGITSSVSTEDGRLLFATNSVSQEVALYRLPYDRVEAQPKELLKAAQTNPSLHRLPNKKLILSFGTLASLKFLDATDPQNLRPIWENFPQMQFLDGIPQGRLFTNSHGTTFIFSYIRHPPDSKDRRGLNIHRVDGDRFVFVSNLPSDDFVGGDLDIVEEASGALLVAFSGKQKLWLYRVDNHSSDPVLEVARIKTPSSDDVVRLHKAKNGRIFLAGRGRYAASVGQEHDSLLIYEYGKGDVPVSVVPVRNWQLPLFWVDVPDGRALLGVASEQPIFFVEPGMSEPVVKTSVKANSFRQPKSLTLPDGRVLLAFVGPFGDIEIYDIWGAEGH